MCALKFVQSQKNSPDPYFTEEYLVVGTKRIRLPEAIGA